MAFHCMNCGGSMTFDADAQVMRCAHCDTTCAPEDFYVRDTSEGMATFVCNNCAAELEGTEDSMVGFCPYCGGQSLVVKPGEPFDVERIIPFQLGRERCAEAYAKYTKGVRYLAREFKDAGNLERFTGIYLPFYQYDATFDAPKITGTRIRNTVSYTEYQNWRVDVEVEGDYEHGAPFDASRYLDDEMAARALPFDDEKLVDFRPAYLAGYYADTSTVPPELYEADAAAQAEQDVLATVVEDTAGIDNLKLDKSCSVETHVTGHHTVLYPLWFLTWRKGERVAYAMVNGESGAVVSDLPLDVRSFWLGFAAVFAVLFVLLEFLFQPTAGTVSAVSLLATACMALAVQAAARRAFETETHAKDKGWQGDPEAKGVGPVRARKSLGMVKIVGVALMLVLFVILLHLIGVTIDVDVVFDARGSLLMKILPALSAGVAVWPIVSILRWRKSLQAPYGPMAGIALVVAVVVNALICYIAPVDDLWYFGAGALCIVCLALSGIAMVQIYTRSTTRPSPELFQRAEVH